MSNTLLNNRGFKYGDLVFETIKISQGKILFWEDHYFRLMSSMRIFRMKIPMEFTMDFLEQRIFENVQSPNARLRINVFRDSEGFYTPKTNQVDYNIESSPINFQNSFYSWKEKQYEVDLFKDYYSPKSLLSEVKSSQRIINILAGIYAKENDLDNVLILNDKKSITEGISHNVFFIFGDKVVTPPTSDGLIRGVFRKNLINFIKEKLDIQLEEKSVNPFEVLKADEVFLTNVMGGIIPVTNYRKKIFETSKTKELAESFYSFISNN